MIPTDPDCEPDVVEAAHPAVMEATARSPKTKLPEERDDEEKEPVAELLYEEDLEPRWVPRSH